MKLVISGVEYPMASIGKATLLDVMELKKSTGMGISDVETHLKRVADLPGDELLNDSEAMVALGALIWLTRRRAGEQLSLEAACDFPLDELEFVAEPGDEEPAPDPQ